MIKEKSVLEIIRQMNEKERNKIGNKMKDLLLKNFEDAQVLFCLKNKKTGEWDSSIISVVRDNKVYTIFGNKSLESNLDQLVELVEFCIEDNRCQVRKISKEEQYIKSILEENNVKYFTDLFEGSLIIDGIEKCEDYIYFDCITDVNYNMKHNELTVTLDEELRFVIDLKTGDVCNE